MKYRKKPVVIEAMQLINECDSIVNCIEFCMSIGMETSILGTNATIENVKNNNGFIIDTLEGKMKVSFGDYIIKGIEGEFYSCKKSIFEASYEKVEE